MKNKVDEQYIYKLISSNIKRFRSLQNISQLGLANKTGLTHNFINDIENCKKGVSAKTLAKLSTALGAEPFQFFLPDGMSNNDAKIYITGFTEILHKTVSDLTQKYFSEDEDKE